MVRTLTASYNASGLELYRALARKPGNVVLSPYSIGSALAMAYSGARGDTAREMASALKIGTPRETVDAANAALLKLLKAYDRTGDPGYCGGGAHWTGRRCEAPPSAGDRCPPATAKDSDACVASPVLPSATLLAANALALPKGAVGVADAYAAVLSASYAAEVLHPGAASDINAWVARKTAGRIAGIVDDLPSGPVLINALYLKAAWHSPFKVAATRDGDFTVSPGKRVTVPMMRQTEQFALVERPGYRALRLDYAERSLGFIVVLPDKVDGLDSVTAGLTAAEQQDLLAALRKGSLRTVAVTLPRFKISLTADLVPPLQAAGMRLAFSDAADFSGITGGGLKAGSLKIEGVRHRAVIEVDEHGTEAAAVTAIGFALLSAPEPTPPVDFVVDRPFLFLVVDTASGAVLFQGSIADPSRRD